MKRIYNAGDGKLIIAVGLYEGKPAVWVAPTLEKGISGTTPDPNAKVKEDEIVIFTFPSRAWAISFYQAFFPTKYTFWWRISRLLGFNRERFHDFLDLQTNMASHFAERHHNVPLGKKPDRRPPPLPSKDTQVEKVAPIINRHTGVSLGPARTNNERVSDQLLEPTLIHMSHQNAWNNDVSEPGIIFAQRDNSDSKHSNADTVTSQHSGHSYDSGSDNSSGGSYD